MAQNYPIIAATYAELALKGRNRSVFLRKLLNNIRAFLKDEPVASINHVESRILIHLEVPECAERVAERLRDVFGLQWISPVAVVPRAEVDPELDDDIEAGREPNLTDVCRLACDLVRENLGGAATFKVATRRSDHAFALKSPEVSRIVGGAIHQEFQLPGKMNDPDLTVNVLVLKDNILVFTAKETAWGGLPAGSSGRVMSLLSGGIDSPVSSWLMMRRGCRPEFVHFYSGRSLKEADTDKIQDLVRILGRYYPAPLKLHLTPVVAYEMRAIGVIPDNYDMVMFRRFMFKTAERLARRNSCQALVTGDSLGQVASQTIRNLGAVGPDLLLPVLRPLVGMDKLEITAWSRKIGAYETSILPYRDCCSIRSPKPILNARPQDLLRFSADMDLDGAVQEALEATVRLSLP